MNSSSQLVTVQHPVDNALAHTLPPLPGSAEMIPFPSGRYAIPPEDMEDFNKHSPKEQERVKFLLSLFARMEAGGIVATSEMLGKQLAAVSGYGASNLRTQYYKWAKLGWRSLPRAFNNGSEPLPVEFIQHVRALMENNARSMKQAMNLITRDWFSGKNIPGFGTWQEWFATHWPERDMPTVCPSVPKGWGKSNLYAIQPVGAQRALKTRGFAAAKGLLASMMRDPGRLMPLQLIVIDDFEIDQMCYHPETRTICRMAGVAAMDVATRRILCMVLKPRTRVVSDDKSEKAKKQTITRAEVRLLLYQILRDFGIPSTGMTILAENAAAAVTTELELTFKNLFGNRVAVTRTGVIDRAVLAHGYKDTGGKPWLKGWIESFFNLMHNVAAGLLPGQKGANYLVKSASHDEKLRLTQRLIGNGPRDARLSDEQLAQAKIPFQTPGELCDAYLQIFKYIADRTDHDMRGFDEVREWRRDRGEALQPWENLRNLTEDEMATVEVVTRMQSTTERWAALFPRVARQPVAPHVLMMLLLTPKKAELKNAKLTFTHSGTGYTWLADPRGEIVKTIRDGSDVLVYFDPARADHAHVCRLDGRPLGEVKRFGTVDITDAKAVSEAERQLAEHYEAHLAEVRSRPLHMLEAAKLAEDKAINAALVEDAEKLRNTKGITATLNRDMPAGDAVTTAVGEQMAAAVVTTELDRAIARKQQRVAEATAAKIEREAAARRAALTTGDADDFLGSGEPSAPAAELATPAAPAIAPQDNNGESLDDYLS